MVSYPFDDNENEFNKITREQLDSMSVAELLELLESINETMTEDNFDDELVEACLDAIDRKSPMPEYPSTDESLKEFEAKLHTTGGTGFELMARRPKHRFARVGLIAASLAVCLFSGMIVVQAAGIDVFGAIASWTGSLLGFNEDGNSAITHLPNHQQFLDEVESWLPAEPFGFSQDTPEIISDDYSGVMLYSRIYKSEESYILFEAISDADGNISSSYEKDSDAVKTIWIGDVPFYLFSNNDTNIAAWLVGSVAFTVRTDGSVETLEELIVNSYGG